jgi:hypothetical protein
VKTKFLLVTITCVVASGILASPAVAKEVPFQTPQQLKTKCGNAGGLYGPPTGKGVYTCQLESGNVIVCGGEGANAKTCEAARNNPQRADQRNPVVRDHRQPTLAEVPEPTLRDHRQVPIVRDHRAEPALRDRRQ